MEWKIMPDKKQEIIQEMFDTISPTYDRLNAILSLSIDKLWRKTTIDRLNIKDEQWILDVATGTGDLAAVALSKAQCNVAGMDLSRRMLGLAVRKMQRNAIHRRYLAVNGNALKMPFRNESFDRVMVAFGIRNMEAPEIFLDEAYRLLIKGGRMAVLEFSIPPNAFIRKIYLLYFTIALPFIGGILSGNHKAYKYLRDSVISFEPPEELEKIMKDRGFEIIESQQLLFGISHLYILGKDQQ
jgi:demethylmenaquinone methyltransferase/2-methoxy-6-polyprenyl-1,4-benzoquinol methylase